MTLPTLVYKLSIYVSDFLDILLQNKPSVNRFSDIFIYDRIARQKYLESIRHASRRANYISAMKINLHMYL